MTTRAAQIECLLVPVIDYRDNSVASAYTAYFYSAGTSTPKNVWTEKEKSNAYTSRTLGSDGTAQLYGDGVYKIIIKDTDSTTVYEWDNIKVQANTFTVQTKADTYTATADDDLILAGGTFTVNIATVNGFTHPLIIKRTSGTITVDPYLTETIDGDSTITLTASDDSAVLYPDTSAGVWRRADRLNGLTATVDELNQISGVTVGGSSAGDIVTIDDTQTLTNKTLTSPNINEAVAVSSTATEINQLHSQGAVAADFAKLHAITVTASQVNRNGEVNSYTNGYNASPVSVLSTTTQLCSCSHGSSWTIGDIVMMEATCKITKGATGGTITYIVDMSGVDVEFLVYSVGGYPKTFYTQHYVAANEVEYERFGGILIVKENISAAMVATLSAQSAGSNSSVGGGESFVGLMDIKKL